MTKNADLFAALKTYTKKGAEGVMLRKVGSKYVRKRSSTLLKVKKFLDTDVKVLVY